MSNNTTYSTRLKIIYFFRNQSIKYLIMSQTVGTTARKAACSSGDSDRHKRSSSISAIVEDGHFFRGDVSSIIPFV